MLVRRESPFSGVMDQSYDNLGKRVASTETLIRIVIQRYKYFTSTFPSDSDLSQRGRARRRELNHLHLSGLIWIKRGILPFFSVILAAVFVWGQSGGCLQASALRRS